MVDVLAKPLRDQISQCPTLLYHPASKIWTEFFLLFFVGSSVQSEMTSETIHADYEVDVWYP